MPTLTSRSALTSGRERWYVNRFYDDLAYVPDAITVADREYYGRAFEAPGAMRALFEHYAVLDEDAAIHREALDRDGKLGMPVWAGGGGAQSLAANYADMMREIADDVTAALIADCGHWIPEERPYELAEHLIAFDRAARARTARPAEERNRMSAPFATRPLAVITGSSTGIGFELARQFAEHGYDLVVTGSSDRVEAAATELRRLGVEVVAPRVDLTDYDGVEELVSVVGELGRPVDVLVLNAGRGVGGDFVRHTALEDELRLIALDVTSTVHVAKRLLPAMVERGRGRVLITSSISATMPTPYEAVSGPSRWFTFAFAESLREELRGSGVTVTALLPGATDSDFHANAGMGQTAIGRGVKNDKRLVAAQGLQALMAGKDHVIGGDRKTKLQGLLNRLLPEPFKAARQDRAARPADLPAWGRH